MNRLCTKNRNKIKPEVLDMLMRLRLSTKSFEEFDYQSAVQHYLNQTIYGLGESVKRRTHRKTAPTETDEADYENFSELSEF